MKQQVSYQTVLCLIGCFLLTCHSWAGDNKYAVTKIPLGFRDGADAVVRKATTQFDVRSERKAYEKITIAVTIFDKDARDEGELEIPYDNHCKLESLDGELYDANGNEIRSLSKDDIRDYSATSEYMLYDDARVRLADMYYDQYPYTVEYTYEFYYKGYLNWPTWYSRSSRYPVEQASFEALVPSDIKFRYWCNIDSLKPLIQNDGSTVVYRWSADMQPKLSKDAYGEDQADLGAMVMMAPEKFEIEDHPGSMQTWKDFGNWVYTLFNDRDALPDDAKSEVHAIADTIKDIHGKIAALYNYLQKRSRFVSIEVGIGSWQPFDAKYVHEKGYGDCKALANYMRALLKEAGIASNPVLIRPGMHRYTMITEFPANQFSHVILAVPLEKDTVWLECTSNALPANFLGPFTENRNALMLTPAGGVVVHTPVCSADQNIQARSAIVSLSTGTEGTADIHLLLRGDERVDAIHELFHETPDIIRKWVINSLGFTNFTNLNFSPAGLEATDSIMFFAIHTGLLRCYTQSGPRIFFQPNLSERQTWIPADIAKRFSPIRFSYPRTIVDTILYKLPPNYKVEALPKPVNLKTSFGSFSEETMQVDEKTLRFIRRKTINVYEIPAKEYPEYRKFSADIVKADRAQVVLVSNQ